MDMVSMPFNGLTSFLPLERDVRHKLNKVYQCPLTGLLHFYIPYKDNDD